MLKFLSVATSCLLVLVKAEGETSHAINDIFQSIETMWQPFLELPEDFRADVQEAIGSWSHRPDAVAAEGCNECVKAASIHAIEVAVKQTKEWCEHAHRNKAKAICAVAAKHPKVSLGFLIEEVRPMALGYTYCIGAGKCSETQPFDELDAIEDTSSPGMIFSHPSVVEGMSSLGDDLLKPDSKRIGESENSVKLGEFGKAFESAESCNHETCKCGSCIMGQSGRLLNDHMGAAIWLCDQHHKCPLINKVCDALRAHPDIAYGFIMGMLKPWKFAAGYCVAEHRCSYHHFHSRSGLKRTDAEPKFVEEYIAEQ